MTQVVLNLPPGVSLADFQTVKPEPLVAIEPAVLLEGYPQVGTPEDVAEHLQLRPDAVRQLCRESKLRAIKVGNLWRIPKAWLEEFMLAGGTAGDEE